MSECDCLLANHCGLMVALEILLAVMPQYLI
jgi:hypothetical protein